MKTVIALLVAFGIAAPSTTAFAADCEDGEQWDEATQACVPAD